MNQIPIPAPHPASAIVAAPAPITLADSYIIKIYFVVCQFSINNCFYSDLYEKNDSAKLAIPLTNPFQEGKIKATFAHVAKPPAVHRSKRGKGSKKGPYQGLQAQTD
jgi:hypothetical protein